MIKETAKKRYGQLQSKRDPYLSRARELSKYTIPSLIPEDGSNGTTEFVTPYQSVGSRGVNNLASKLLTSLFPPNEPFFRLTIDDFDLSDLAADEEKRGLVESALASIEQSARMEIESRAFRVPMFEGLRHLILAGNVCLFQPPNSGEIRVYTLSQYVCERTSSGQISELIIKENVSLAKLSKEALEYHGIEVEQDSPLSEQEIERYTRLIMIGKDKFILHQEINDKEVIDSSTELKASEIPYLVLRFVRVEGEDYGRGFVEEYAGDLMSLESLSKAIVEGAAAKARILFLINPNSALDVEDLEQTPNLGFAMGRAEDVGVLSVDKAADFNFALQFAERLEVRLARTFMLSSSVQRNGERVTAEEIRYMASELENALGGIYSLLSQELQLPIVRQLIREMEREGKMPKFPEGVLKPQIVTGMDAIGRDLDRTKIERFIKTLAELGDTAMSYLNWGDIIHRYAASSGLQADGLVKSPEQLQAEQQQQQEQMQQQQMMEMAKSAAPTIAKGMTE